MESQGSKVKFSTLSDQPAYNVKAVCLRTGITATTLRAWERRYGLPSPHRSVQGYRLYSERDIAILDWLLQQTNSGLSISYAVQQLMPILQGDQELAIRSPLQPILTATTDPRSPEVLIQNIADALLDLDESRADTLITEAFALYTPETVLTTILMGVLDTIDQEVTAGIATIVAENMASNTIKRRITILLQATPIIYSKRAILLVGFADERTELELLILNALLRRSGLMAATILLYDETGTQIVAEEANGINAVTVIFYADNIENAARLAELPVILDQAGVPIWLICCGKGAMKFDVLNGQRITHIDYWGDDLRQVVRELFHSVRSPFSRKARHTAQREAIRTTS
ncbi:MAG: MerR family transcriptional regulator [Anaerolineae bacterium]|nr:MerR family transcriptional regulator [Anaerolineae bacterium]